MSASKDQLRTGSGNHGSPRLVSATGIPLISSPPSHSHPQVDNEQEHLHQLHADSTRPIHHENSDGDDSSITHKHIKSPSVKFSLPIQGHEDLAVISRKTLSAEGMADHGFKPKLRNTIVPALNLESLDSKKSDLGLTSVSVKTLYKVGENLNRKSEMGPLHLQTSISRTDLSLLKEDIMPARKAETRWDTAFHQLSRTLAGDERFMARNIALHEKGSDSSDDDDGDDERTRQETLAKPNIFIYAPFSYSQRPFRAPKLGAEVVGRELDDFQGVEGEEKEDYEYRYQLSSPSAATMRWSGLSHSTNLFNIIRKWNCPEPSPEGEPLPVDVDPLVKYKVERKAKQGPIDQDYDPTKEEKQRIQNKIGVGISISGRKLAGYSSDSGEEKVFKRVQCRHDPDFDVLEPTVDVGPEGDWPNPFLHYWNWKQTDEDVDEFLKSRDTGPRLERKLQIAEQMARDPMKIPLCKIGDDDTDESDPGDPQEKYYRKYYKVTRIRQARKRKSHRLALKIRGKYHSGSFTCSCYPIWYLAWKKCFRHAQRKLPRRWKFVKGSKMKTLFYGTMASLYETQYLAEYDLLPNMDDPVMMSEVALARAMEIKEQFLVQPEDGSKPYVDYINLQRSESYTKYFECIGLLCRYQPIKMPPRVRKVFFLNFFNVLSIQTQIRRIPELEYMKYLWEMDGFWERSKGLAGYLELSLEEIYHGILRCNRVHPLKQAKVFVEDHKGFPKEMSTIRLSLDWFDPRIHFALNVGTKACPPLMIFSLYEQDCQLEEVARTYIRSKVIIDEDARTVTLPILFLWYEKDFGNNQRVLLWYLKRYLFPKDTLKIRRLVTSNRTLKFRYERFDDELEPLVIRHPPSQCRNETPQKKIIPEYWGHRF